MTTLESRAIYKSDWPIARLVGSATYAQLMDSAPGLYEPFGDWRGTGSSSTSLRALLGSFGLNMIMMLNNDCTDENVARLVPPEVYVPTPPNLVSTVLYDGNISGLDLKTLLINACESGEIDERIGPLVGSSIAYTNPVLTLGEIVLCFAVVAAVVSIISGVVLRTQKEDTSA